MTSRRVLLFLLLGGIFADAARAADEPAIPAIPSLAVPADQLGEEQKFFVLYKAGVSVEDAQADLSFCWRFLAHGVPRQVPAFVPWRQPSMAKPIDYSAGPFGLLVGVAIGAIIAGPIDRGIRQMRMIRCMVPRGYARYRTSEDVWKQLNTDDAARSIRLQALIAAGPVPPTPRVLP